LQPFTFIAQTPDYEVVGWSVRLDLDTRKDLPRLVNTQAKAHISDHRIQRFSLPQGRQVMAATIQKQVLIGARALIEDPAHWTRGTLARTARDHPVAWHNRGASKWCAMGALYRSAFHLLGDKTEAMRIGDEVIDSIYPRRWLRSALPTLNDRQGHSAVLAVLDGAMSKNQPTGSMCGGAWCRRWP
jgi:hypothetical protein